MNTCLLTKTSIIGAWKTTKSTIDRPVWSSCIYSSCLWGVAEVSLFISLCILHQCLLGKWFPNFWSSLSWEAPVCHSGMVHWADVGHGSPKNGAPIETWLSLYAFSARKSFSQCFLKRFKFRIDLKFSCLNLDPSRMTLKQSLHVLPVCMYAFMYVWMDKLSNGSMDVL